MKTPSSVAKRWTEEQEPDRLLESAIAILTATENTFVVKPWRSITNPTTIKAGRRATDPIIQVPVAQTTGEITMAKAQAEVKQKELNAAKKTAAKKGITKPKHEPSPVVELAPGESAPGVKGVFPQAGVDRSASAGSNDGVNSTNPSGETKMTEDVKKTAAQIETEHAAAKVAQKEARLKEKAEAKEKAEKEKEARKVEREAKAAEAKLAREAKQAETLEKRKADAGDTKRTYFGSMTALADRVKSGVYTKGLTGQLRSSDELALALDAVPVDNVIKLAIEALALPENPYAALNRGQQSMNLRNKLRGAIRADEGMGQIIVAGTETEPPVRCTLARVIELRDANGYATAEDEATKKKEAREAKVKAKADELAKKKAEADAAAKKAAEAKAAAKTETQASA